MSDPAYVFDAYGTLFDVHSAVARYADAIGDTADALSALWRDKQLQYTWIRALAGRHLPFDVVTADALDFAITATGGVPDGLRARLLEAYDQLSAYDEVPGVLARLKAGGARLAILSNGTPQMLASAIVAAGLTDTFDAVLSVEEIGIYKPDARVYQLACDRLETPADAVRFHSSNRWDIAGAQAFGFTCTWVNRFGAPDEFGDMAPTRVVSTLAPIADG
ncbi:MAG: haloacid dehalogenase type II [Pseudomonadota bacterium]